MIQMRHVLNNWSLHLVPDLFCPNYRILQLILTDTRLNLDFPRMLHT